MEQDTIRGENYCLNCNAIVQGRYCQQCGQENVHLHYGFWGLVKHFIYDIFHFDGKFFKTMRLLLQKPGKVPRNYVEGKRVRYLDPIRMYLFISALTFFLFIFFANYKDSIENIHIIATPLERLAEANRNYELLQSAKDSTAARQNLSILLDTSIYLRLKRNSDTLNNGIPFHIEGEWYAASPLHDSVMFPETNWLQRRISNNMRKKLKNEGEDFNQLILNQTSSIFNMMPYMLFLSLPVFTLILKLLFRRTNHTHFSGHAVFTLYYYILAFCILIVVLLLSQLFRYVDITNLNLIHILSVSVLLIYLYAGMKNFYQEGILTTFVKFLLVVIVSVLVFMGLFYLLTLGSLFF